MPMPQAVGGICLTPTLISLASSGRSEELVGDYGDYSRLQLQGLERLDPQEARTGLQLDFELCLASHRALPKDSFRVAAGLP